jgi:Spy/CpxP family protein refolding chaperone
MKLQKLAALLFAIGVLFSAAVQAQDQKEPSGEGRRGKGGQGQGRGQMMSPEERVAQLDKVLSLTDEQKTKIKEIYTKAGEEMRAAFRNGGAGGDREAARAKMVEMMRKTREDVRAQLTDEQKKKFDEIPQRGGGDQGGRGRGKRGGENK